MIIIIIIKKIIIIIVVVVVIVDSGTQFLGNKNYTMHRKTSWNGHYSSYSLAKL